MSSNIRPPSPQPIHSGERRWARRLVTLLIGAAVLVAGASVLRLPSFSQRSASELLPTSWGVLVFVILVPAPLVFGMLARSWWWPVIAAGKVLAFFGGSIFTEIAFITALLGTAPGKGWAFWVSTRSFRE